MQAHYDLSDDFFRLFLDPTQTYSCAYFERDDMTLEEAQIAKIDLSLGKLGLQPGMTLLDIGCGWGATMNRAIEQLRRQRRRPDAEPEPAGPRRAAVRRVGQPAQQAGAAARAGSSSTSRSTGSCRSARSSTSAATATTTSSRWPTQALPDDGVMMLHTIIKPSDEEFAERGLPLTMTQLRFIKFIMDEIFPGGDLPKVDDGRGARRPRPASRSARVQPLRLHYARTLDIWAAALEARKDEAIAIQSARGLRPVHEVPDRLRGPVPRGLHRRLPVHADQELVTTQAAPQPKGQ